MLKNEQMLIPEHQKRAGDLESGRDFESRPKWVVQFKSHPDCSPQLGLQPHRVAP